MFQPSSSGIDEQLPAEDSSSVGDGSGQPGPENDSSSAVLNESRPEISESSPSPEPQNDESSIGEPVSSLNDASSPALSQNEESSAGEGQPLFAVPSSTSGLFLSQTSRGTARLAGSIRSPQSSLQNGRFLSAEEPSVSGGDNSSISDVSSLSSGYTLEQITQQEIAHPDTLFYAGQTGALICSLNNTTFIQAALSAGYRQADGAVYVTLDRTLELELPVWNSQIVLPEYPPELSTPYEGDAFFSHTFSGWSLNDSDPSSSVMAAGTLLDIDPAQTSAVSLFSVWESVSQYLLRIQIEFQPQTAVYSLMNDRTGEAATAPEGYVFSYQWQFSEQDGPWTDIAGAQDAVYQRALDPSGSNIRLRCQVSAQKQALTRSVSEPVTLYSEPVNAATELHTVYVDQTNGTSTGTGTQDSPLQTLDQAAQRLPSSSAGGTAATNRIIIIGSYQLESNHLFQMNPVPVTISGSSAGTVFTGCAESSTDWPLRLYDDLTLESITVKSVNHIYGNGYNITIGSGVSNPDSAFYLYGSGQDALSPAGVGEISVYSGTIVRIVGYVRSNNLIDVENQKSKITVGGTAVVGTIVAGSASGEIQNGDVTVNIEGGSVATLIGGNQGYSDVPSPYSGKTEINIRGGKVGSILGAGSGRNTSIPTYLGQMSINVSGGHVDNIYGAGSAAFVISNESIASTVGISVSGGTVTNIFAAGKGGDASVSSSFDNFTQSPSDFGSLTGSANITVSDSAQVENIYASGEGYQSSSYDTSGNAYLKGNVSIQVSGGTVTGNIYGGGKGISTAGYENCARVEDASVEINITGGIVQGNVFGGGQTAKIIGSTSVSLSRGTVQGNMYGGGKEGLVDGSTTVEISSGTVYGSVYGGALGTPNKVLVNQGSTVNMTGGWIRGNLYGGSELSDDGQPAADPLDLILVNLAGGTVSGNVFGGGYRGVVNGSTHLHIGKHALEECLYYQGHPSDMPVLTGSSLSIGGSVYAGGDFGGDEIDYDAITVQGTSHVYIDGTGYSTGSAQSGPDMTVSGGVFGSGASCDAGLTRLVTLKNYGEPVRTDGLISGATRTLAAIQRADRVLLINSHVRLTGQTDVANTNQTALYSLNRIGDHGEDPSLGILGNGLVLQGGSTLILESAALELAKLKSVDSSGNELTLDGLAASPNTLLLDTGTVLRISYMDETGTDIYGMVSGYTYLLPGETAEAYIYARVKTADVNTGDGNFADGQGTELPYTNVTSAASPYRYWQVTGSAGRNAVRSAVLTAQTLPNHDGEYAVAGGTIDLPPADNGSTYTVKSVTLPGGGRLTLVDAALSGPQASDGWVTSENNVSSGTAVDLAAQQSAIANDPLTSFGLFMRIGAGFSNTGQAPGKVISTAAAAASGTNSVIGSMSSSSVAGEHVTPTLEFYLTYYNSGITASQNLGTVEILVERSDASGHVQETTTINLEIVTKATALSGQTVDLYATQAGSYTGKLYIPSGSSRSLELTGVSAAEGVALTPAGSGSLSGYQFTLSMLPDKTRGWLASSLMSDPYDLGSYASSGNMQIGSTDSRYDAPIEFTLKNAPGFSAKSTEDIVMLTITDNAGDTATIFQITLRIHWKASVVSEVQAGPGRQYNQIAAQNHPVISQESAVTAAFTLPATNNISDLWLELQDGSGNRTRLPAGTKLTLLGLTGFYYYEVTGTETEATVPLSSFTLMWGDQSLSGTISPVTLTVIADFAQAQPKLPVGEYSLRLRDDIGADSMGADFTLDNTGASMGLSASGGTSQGQHTFTLTISPGSDTRLAGGAAVTLSPDAGEVFPDGAVFLYNNTEYYPSGGKVYIPLSGSGTHTIVMDTEKTAGLPPKEYSLTVRVFPAGDPSDAAGIVEGRISYSVHANPSYGLDVDIASTGSRAVSGGDSLSFTAKYAVQNTGTGKHQILLSVEKKTNGQYVPSANWVLAGNTFFEDGAGEQSLTVTVPEGLTAGTYRLIFELGSQSVPFNIIVQ